MRLPTDIGSDELISLLGKYGYRKTRQTGSHVRLTTVMNGEHHITIPGHKQIRVCTLHSVVKFVQSVKSE
jgi:predicted RNA binding protein YcfA (HicA-like mRNA interferase family)